MAGIKIPVSAEFDKGDVDKSIADFTQRVNRLGAAIAQANKMKFRPVDRAAIDDMRKMEQQFSSLLKINSGLRQRISSSGQSGASFTSLDWSRVYADSSQRGRVMRSAFDYVTAGTGLAGSMHGADPASRTPGRGVGAGGGYPGQGIVDRTLGGAGPVGGIAARGIAGAVGGASGGGGLLGGLSGLARFAGPAALAFAGYKAVSAVANKVGSAEQEAIGYDALKRVLGDVNVEFNYLRGSLRQTGESLNLTYGESLKLGTEFAKLSGMTADRYKTLGGEVGIGVGLSRSFGVDPSRGNSLMATLRLGGATGSEADSRRMALMIGEAVGKVGFSKADEVMQAVAGFTMNVARTSLSSGNVAGYAGMLSSLAGSRTPGLDAAGSAALLGRINASIEGGGAAGEAGQNFMLAAIGRPMGLSPIGTRMQLQKGAFGIGAGGKTNFQMIMEGLQSRYSAFPKEFMYNAGANLLGINESQFAGVHAAIGKYGYGSLSGIQGSLDRVGVPMSSLKDAAFGRMAAINVSSHEDLLAEAARVRADRFDPLSAGEAKKLDAAMGGSDSGLKDVLIGIAAVRSQENTQGLQVLKSTVGVENATQRLATELIPATMIMRDALIALASTLAPSTPFSKAQAAMSGIQERSRILEAQPGELAAFDAATQARLGEIPANMRETFLSKRASIRQNMVGRQRGDLIRAGGGMGGTDALMSALIAQESGGQHLDPVTGRLTMNATSGALGITQIRPGTGADPGFGVRPLQNQSQAEYVRFGRDYLSAMIFRYGDTKKGLAAYNWGFGNVDSAIKEHGDDWLRFAPKETQDYVSNIEKNAGMYGTAVPGSSTAGAGRGTTSSEHDVVLNIKDGRTNAAIASPIRVRVPAVAASGAR